jgi:hypothetical protein
VVYYDPTGYYAKNISTGAGGGGYGYYGPGLSQSKWNSIRWSNGGSNGNSSPKNSQTPKPGMNNKRVMNNTTFKGYNVSMDVERGGSA